MKSFERLPEDSYWNHNAAYHGWILRRLGQNCGRVLDVGCGEGLLVRRLASNAAHVIGIDPDAEAVERAKGRLPEGSDSSVACADFLEYAAPPGSFDAVVFVASLHHMDAEAALRKAKNLLTPSGRMLVVGCAKNKSPADWIIDVCRTPAARLGTLLHGETDPGVATRAPAVSYAEMRRLAKTIFATVRSRRGLYYRYLLTASGDRDRARQDLFFRRSVTAL